MPRWESSWTEERVEILKKLWADGWSGTQIANALGGVSANAVIGKVHRLGLAEREKKASNSARLPKAKKAMSNVARFNMLRKPTVRRESRPMLVEIVVPISLHTSLEELTDQTCRWPIGDPGDPDFHYCGHEPREGAPYCKYHAHIAYIPVDSRQGRRALGF